VPPGVTGDSLKADLESLVGRLVKGDPGFRAKVETRAFGPALETPFDAPLVQMLAKCHQKVSGDEALIGPEARYGLYGDASLLSETGITSVVYGPGGGLSDLDYEWEVIQGLRSPDERIRVHDLIVAAKVLTQAAISFCS
jgi:acetylornithine deacetylase/succinyl-diaminopimelate desuccinylase-like protein